MTTSNTITKTDLINILNEVLPSGQYIETLEYVGNYGQTIFDSSWTATNDGIMVEMLGSNTSGATAYWYINDTNENKPVGCISMNANGTTNSTCFPIIKGHTYSSAAKAAVNSANAYFFKYTLKETVPDSAVDYIVEQGTSGIWTYRKWNSGIAECWGEYDKSVTGVSMTAPFSGYNFDLGTVAFPTGLFNAKPVCTVSGRKNGNYTCVSYCNPSSTGVAIEFQSSVSGTAVCEAHIHAKGKWK